MGAAGTNTPRIIAPTSHQVHSCVASQLVRQFRLDPIARLQAHAHLEPSIRWAPDRPLLRGACGGSRAVWTVALLLLSLLLLLLFLLLLLLLLLRPLLLLCGPSRRREQREDAGRRGVRTRWLLRAAEVTTRRGCVTALPATCHCTSASGPCHRRWDIPCRAGSPALWRRCRPALRHAPRRAGKRGPWQRRRPRAVQAEMGAAQAGRSRRSHAPRVVWRPGPKPRDRTSRLKGDCLQANDPHLPRDRTSRPAVRAGLPGRPARWGGRGRRGRTSPTP